MWYPFVLITLWKPLYSKNKFILLADAMKLPCSLRHTSRIRDVRGLVVVVGHSLYPCHHVHGKVGMRDNQNYADPERRQCLQHQTLHRALHRVLDHDLGHAFDHAFHRVCHHPSPNGCYDVGPCSVRNCVLAVQCWARMRRFHREMGICDDGPTDSSFPSGRQDACRCCWQQFGCHLDHHLELLCHRAELERPPYSPWL